MLREIIHNPLYLLFLLIVLLVVAGLIWSLVGQGTDIGQWIFGYFKSLFG